MTRRTLRWVALGSTVALLPVVLYAASQQDANGLYVFSAGEKILSQEVNDNFKVVSDFMTTYEEALTVDARGNVGVGVANPSQVLDVNGTVKATSFVGDGSALTGISGLSQWSSVTGGIGYSGGNVGIGTTSPEARLHISNGFSGGPFVASVNSIGILESNNSINLDLETPANKSTGIRFDTGADTRGHISYYGPDYGGGYSDKLIFGAGSADRVAIDGTSGNVGIGTITPLAKLHVAGNIRANSGSVIQVGSAVNGISDTGLNDRITLIASNRDVLTALGSGNVGIGTASPIDSLTVYGDSITDQQDLGANSIVTAFSMRNGRNYNDYGGLYSPFAMLNIVTPGPTTTGESNDHRIADLRFALKNSIDSAATSDVLTLRYNGNVGIGTTTPHYTLEVNGTFHATTVSVMADVTADDYLFNSDARLKTDILPLENASEGIACLQGATYRWSDPQTSQSLQLGLIAQDVERCFPEVVTTRPDGYKSVSYARLVVPLIENAKEQQQVSELQQRTLAAQQQELATQQQRLKAQEQELARLESEQAATNARLARLEALLSTRR